MEDYETVLGYYCFFGLFLGDGATFRYVQPDPDAQESDVLGMKLLTREAVTYVGRQLLGSPQKKKKPDGLSYHMYFVWVLPLLRDLSEARGVLLPLFGKCRAPGSALAVTLEPVGELQAEDGTSIFALPRGILKTWTTKHWGP
jgi:hypothetical protein